MPKYHLQPDGSFLRLADGAYIPACPGNNDYEALCLEIEADHSVADVAPAPVKPTEQLPAA